MSTVSKGTKRAKHPPWWTADIESGWQSDLEQVMNRYEQDKTGKGLLRWLARRAVGFGHAARHAHPQIHSWRDLEDKLRLDWLVETSRPEAAWDKVSAAIRYGWDSALTDPVPQPTG